MCRVQRTAHGVCLLLSRRTVRAWCRRRPTCGRPGRPAGRVDAPAPASTFSRALVHRRVHLGLCPWPRPPAGRRGGPRPSSGCPPRACGVHVLQVATSTRGRRSPNRGDRLASTVARIDSANSSLLRMWLSVAHLEDHLGLRGRGRPFQTQTACRTAPRRTAASPTRPGDTPDARAVRRRPRRTRIATLTNPRPSAAQPPHVAGVRRS